MEKTGLSKWLWDKMGLSFWTVWHEYFLHRRFNWITLNLIQFEIDWDKQCGEVATTIQLLGFGMMWQCRYKPFEDTKIGEIFKEHKSSDKVTQQKTALKVLEQIENGASIALLKEQYQNMKVTFSLEDNLDEED